MAAYYNEIDPYAAQWLRNLIAAGHIADGVVDVRSISDVTPEDLNEFTQCHFFAGIGVWSHALRLAQWPDTRPVWTGSCPCQPFSVAGAGAGVRDQRHLWPHWFWLIEQCRPEIIFGEQVEAAIRHGWLDLVQSDMEGIDYAFAASGLPAAGVGAPHIRQRIFFVADANDKGSQRYRGLGQVNAAQRWEDEARHRAEVGASVWLADATSLGFEQGRGVLPPQECDGPPRNLGLVEGQPQPSTTDSFWANADWLLCRDGKWRPVEPSTFPLANGAASRVGRLRAYGNAIVPQAAQAFIEDVMEVRP